MQLEDHIARECGRIHTVQCGDCLVLESLGEALGGCEVESGHQWRDGALFGEKHRPFLAADLAGPHLLHLAPNGCQQQSGESFAITSIIKQSVVVVADIFQGLEIIRFVETFRQLPIESDITEDRVVEISQCGYGHLEGSQVEHKFHLRNKDCFCGLE